MGKLKDRLLKNRGAREQDRYEEHAGYQDQQPQPQPQMNQLTPEQQQLVDEIQRYQQQYQQQQEQYQQYQQQPPQEYPPEYQQQYQQQSPTPYDAHLRKLAEQEALGGSTTMDADTPLSLLDEIKEKPAPKGALPVIIGGRPLDLHALEDYVVKISPFSLKTVLRYHNARTIEEIKGYGKGPNVKLKGGMIIFILFAVAMAILGIFIIMFMPDLMNSFSGGGGFLP